MKLPTMPKLPTSHAILSALALLAFAPRALAHGGHGAHGAGSPLHYLLEPAHLPFTLLAVAAAALVLRGMSRRVARRTAHPGR